MDKLSVALLFGGRSSEHSISCATAGGVLGAIDRDRFEVMPIGITREGAFVLAARRPRAVRPRPRAPARGRRQRHARALAGERRRPRELRVTDAAGERSLGDVDVVFPILHGRFGEDGTVQGMLELVGLPVRRQRRARVGARHGQALHEDGARRARASRWRPWVTLTRAASGDATASLWGRRARALGLPVFVKPARAGSSVGVTQGRRLDGARRRARGRVRRGRHGAHRGRPSSAARSSAACSRVATAAMPRVSVAGEIVVRGREFYDFEAKYLDAPGVELGLPRRSRRRASSPRCSASRAARSRRSAARGWRASTSSSPTTGFVVNEINTMPGFTPISMFPTCWLSSGLSYPELITELIEVGPAAAAGSASPARRGRYSARSSRFVHCRSAAMTETAGERSAIAVVPETSSLSTSTSTAGVRP